MKRPKRLDRPGAPEPAQTQRRPVKGRPKLATSHRGLNVMVSLPRPKP